MGLLDVLLRKVIQIAGTALTERKYFNFVSGVSGVDNTTTEANDLTIINHAGTASSATNGGTVHNVSTDGISQLRYTHATPPSISGLANGVAGKRVSIMATAGALTLLHANAGSTAGNKLSLNAAGSVTVAAGTATALEYDAVSGVWRQLR